MEIEDVLEKPLVVRPGDSVSHVASRMLAEKRHEAIVLDSGNNFLGIVLARDIVKKKLSDPHNAKIDQFIIEEKPLLPGTSLSEIINAFLVNDYKTIPVKKDGKIMLLTKLDVLRLVKNDSNLKGKTAEDAMKFPYCINSEDSLSTARAVLKDMNVSRLPVLRDGKVEGMIDTLDLLSPIVKGEISKRGEPDEERTHLDSVPASSFMRRNFPTAEAVTPLGKVVDSIVRTQSAVVVERNGKLMGIIAPGDVLKLLGKEVKGAYVTISGIEDEDDLVKSVVYDEIEASLKKINKIYPVNYLVVHADRYGIGKKTKHLIKTRLATGKGFFFAQDHDWDLTKAIKGVLANLEKEVIKRKEKFGF
ncbi:MAG: CBS domain-containing protein [Candidatus Aenigmarchaeota archaeon]|nr:CBS domain-containing protein [Candidatus Aenigmarchaeota archaeon]